MNIETVNELIASLESAGELSIREQKFLKLAKAFKQLAEENAALKSSRAILAENALETCNEESTGNRNKYPNPIRTLVDEAKRNIETPATDRIVAGIKAEGAEACVRALVTSDDDDFTDAPNICAMVAYQLRDGGNGE